MLPALINDSTTFEKRLHLACPSDTIEQLARTSQFMKRSFRKISPMTFLQGLIGGTITAFPSLNLIAATMAAITGVCISKQAVEKRIRPDAVQFMQRLLRHVVSYPLAIHSKQTDGFWKLFSQVWLWDSTTIKLHPDLRVPHAGSRKPKSNKKTIRHSKNSTRL